MLSTIIYEAVDFVYTISRVTYKSVSNLYNWYNKKNGKNQLDIIEKKIVELEEQRAKLCT